MKPKASLRNLLLGSALFAAASTLHAADGIWITDGDGLWTEPANWSGGTIASGTGSTAFFTAELTTATRVVTLGDHRVIGHIVFTDGVTSSHNLAIQGADILTLAGTTPGINVTQADRVLSIDSVIAGSAGLTKTGAGSLFLRSSAKTFTGGVTIHSGRLSLEFETLATPTDLIPGANAVTLNHGGRLTVSGKTTGTTSQTFAGVTESQISDFLSKITP